MRQPAVAGMFYPSGKRSLEKEIERCIKSGPGKEYDIKGNRIYGIVSPHAGYTYSGTTASFGFMAMRSMGIPDTVLVIGPNHRGAGRGAVIADDDFLTPLGIMEFDGELADALGLGTDLNTHRSEHSMEVQLPFVQYLGGDVKQVCISVSDQSLRSSKNLGMKMANALRETDRSVVMIASSDFTHCGWNYGYPVPGGKNAGEFARSIDIPVIKELERWDLENAFKKKEKLGVTACGLGPVAAVMTASKELGAKNSVLLDYRTSYDVIPSDSAVGYASLIFYS